MASEYPVNDDVLGNDPKHRHAAVAQCQQNLDGDQLRLGVELGSAVEEVVTSLMSKHPAAAGISSRQAWESIETLAKSKISRLHEQSKSQGLHAAGEAQINTQTNGGETALHGTAEPFRAGNANANSSIFMEQTAPLEQHSYRPSMQPRRLAESATDRDPSQVFLANREVATIGRHISGTPPSYLRSQVPIRGNEHQPSGRTQTQQSYPPKGSANVSIPQPNARFIKRKTCRKNPLPSSLSRPLNVQSGPVGDSEFRVRLHQNRLEEQALNGIRLRTGRRGRPSDRIACARCRIRKKKCRGDGQYCDACRESKLYPALCIPAEFKECLYEMRIVKLLDNVDTWLPNDPSEPIIVKVCSGFEASLDIALRPYIPVNPGALTHVLFRGIDGGVIAPRASSTAYGLEEGTLTAEKIDQYCDDLSIELVLDEARQAQGKNTLATHILLFAASRCHDHDMRSNLQGLNLVKLALRHWAMQAVFFKFPWIIKEGASRIGMTSLSIPGCWSGKTLLPRLVNQELDRAFERRMDELEKILLEKLQHAVFNHHRHNWCSIFLASFILLHSLEKDFWNMNAWDYEKNRPGGTPWPLKRDPSEYCTQNKHIADTLSTHFRIVSHGHTPFAIDWSKPLNRELLNEDEDARHLVSSIQKDLSNSDSNYRRALSATKEFNRDDIGSLGYLYTKKLVLE
ncbi:hypothetical protein QQS21_010495 [Conoideocrella luteorostrata]|uniref:Zn(2)-C6 fungal-type domain-containing protein n=1 Tax=Conoideocrella luteorostrata TaxID=1105319 RepID=A0AAJ0FU49_9HYPO|nr:hypothetical protein QQS21_010495 [Conoideocrella luteorostrata]